MIRPFHHDVAETVTARIVALSAMLIAELCISRMLQPAGRGSYALFLSSIGILEALFSMGFVISLVRMVSQQLFPASCVAAWSLLYGLLQGLLGCVFFYGIATMLQPAFLEGLDPDTWMWMAICLPSFLISQNLSCVVLGLRKSSLTNFCFFIQRSLFGVLVVLSLIFGLSSLRWIMGLYSFSMLVTMLASIVYVHRHIGFSFSLTNMGSAFVWLYQHGFSIQVGTIFARLSFWSDSFFVNGFLGREALGYYAIARSATDLILHLPTAVGLMLLPRVSHDPGKRNPQTTARVARVAMFVQFWLGLGAACGAALIIAVLLPGFIPAIPILFLLFPGTLGFGVFQILIQDFLARGFGSYHLFLNLFLFLILCALLSQMVPLWGLVGAGIGIALARVALGASSVWLFAKKNHISIRQITVIEYQDCIDIIERLNWKRWRST
jgi:O-antigen/teichoic acid export membrane protein